MGSHKCQLFSAALLVLQGCGVFGQLVGGSEFVNQGTTQSVATSTSTAAATTATGAGVSSGGHTGPPAFVIPAIIKPILYPEPYAQAAPSFGNYAPAFAPAHPPVIISDDGDNMNHLLFLLFAMNKRGLSGGRGNSYSCGCGCGCNGGCGCGNSYGYDSSYGNGNYGCESTGYSNNNYMPYPIPIPYNSGYYANGQITGINGAPIADTSCGCAYGDEITVIQNPVTQPRNGPLPNEINLIIRADTCNCPSK